MNKLYGRNINTSNETTQQDIISNDCNLIKQHLENYIQIKGKKLKDINLGTWIKYITNTGKFRTGGVLTVNSFPEYMVLKNPTLNKSWSVNLKTNNIYIKENLSDKKEEEREKNVLYKLYKQGLLEIIEPQ